jgi:hypothetical protein
MQQQIMQSLLYLEDGKAHTKGLPIFQGINGILSGPLIFC